MLRFRLHFGLEIRKFSGGVKMIENAVTQDTFVEYDDRKDISITHFTVPSTIGPEDGRHLFSYIGVFLTQLTPRDLTVGMDYCEKITFYGKFTKFTLIFFSYFK